MLALSNGTKVRGSRTSALIPSLARISAAANAFCAIQDQATMVTSVPCRMIDALPSGTRYSSSGTSPLMPSSCLCSMNSTGLLSRIAEAISPLASAGVDGMTVFRPGIWVNQASMDWECCAAAATPAPAIVLTTRGTFALPPNI